jgi:hypothetical protein
MRISRALKKEEARLNRSRYGGKEKGMSDQKEKDMPDQAEIDLSNRKVDFSCLNGEHFATCREAEGMPVNSIVTINGEEDLSGIVQFDHGGRVYGIRLKGSPGFYDYVVEVDAKGPHGIGTGSGHLKFTDASNDTYELSIYSSTRSDHTVRYNSDKPNIKLIKWSS